MKQYIIHTSIIKSILPVLFVIIVSPSFAQKVHCDYTLLSPIYDYSIDAAQHDRYKGIVTVTIKTKAGDTKQTITYAPSDWELLSYTCSSMSFVTGYYTNRERFGKTQGGAVVIEEGRDVDIVVADFNFDGKEDFAVKDGYKFGDYKPFFRFYFQDDNGHFIEQTDFPYQGIDAITNTLPLDVDSLNQTVSYMKDRIYLSVFRYNSRKNTWKEIKPVKFKDWLEQCKNSIK